MSFTNNPRARSSSTRVSHQPGGAQTFSVFGHNENNSQQMPTATGRRGSRAGRSSIFSNEQAQPTKPKSSTRLHAPPGGRASNPILGGDSDAPACMPKKATASRVDNIFNAPAPIARSSTRRHAAPGGQSSAASVLNGTAPAESSRSVRTAKANQSRYGVA